MTYLVGGDGTGVESVNADTGPAAIVSVQSAFNNTGNTNIASAFGGFGLNIRKFDVDGAAPVGFYTSDGTIPLASVIDTTVDSPFSVGFVIDNLAADSGTNGLAFGMYLANEASSKMGTGFYAINNTGGTVSANLFQAKNNGTISLGSVFEMINESGTISAGAVAKIQNTGTGTFGAAGMVELINGNAAETGTMLRFSNAGTGSDIQLSPRIADPSTLVSGDIWFHNTEGNIKLYNGSVKILQTANKTVTAETGTRNLTDTETGRVFTNEGDADGSVHNLPTAVAGLTYTFCVQAGQTVTINANTGDQIQVAASTSSVAGSVASSTVGDVITLTAINATEWFATSVVGAGWATA